MEVKTLRTDDGLVYRDLNKNGRLDPYEDRRRPLEERVDDLLAQMTLSEKAGLMFHTMMPLSKDGSLVEGPGPFGPFSTSELVQARLMSHFNLLAATEPRQMAGWHNRLQALAEGTRLGIPVTISSEKSASWPSWPGFPPSWTSAWNAPP